MDDLRRDHHRDGRGRRHACPPPRAFGEAHPPARAWRLAAARARELGRRRRYSWTTAMSPPDTWYDAQGKPFQPGVHYYVGGATKFYGAALFRLRKEDFGELQHHDGLSPAWPIAYDELEPYYTLAEQLYQVHGARGEDPTEPPASAPYPHPAVSHEPRIQQLADDLRRPATTRSTLPAGSCSTSRTRRSAAAFAAAPATASRASSMRSPTPRCSACAPRSSIRT